VRDLSRGLLPLVGSRWPFLARIRLAVVTDVGTGEDDALRGGGGQRVPAGAALGSNSREVLTTRNPSIGIRAKRRARSPSWGQEDVGGRTLTRMPQIVSLRLMTLAHLGDHE